MENFEDTFQAENALNVNKQIEAYLRETTRWGKFLAIVGFVMMGILVLLGISMATVFPAFSEAAGTQFPVVMALVYVLLGLLYFFPLFYLYRFSSRIKEALMVNNEAAFTSGFENLKSLFKFMGIFTIVIMAIYLVVILLAVAIGTSVNHWF